MEAMQRVITAEEHEAPEQQPNHLDEAEKMHEEEEVHETGKSESPSRYPHTAGSFFCCRRNRSGRARAACVGLGDMPVRAA